MQKKSQISYQNIGVCIKMRRNISEKLISWKESEDRKPLLIKGVRQCGKTYLLKEFGANNYEDVAYFNFEGNDALNKRFEKDLDVERIVEELSILRNKTINPNSTLIIFDEIQFCNRALTSLKYFCENAPEYHVVGAGSLLGIALSKPLSFPVGKVNILTLRPMCFQEFLKANNEDMLVEYLEKLLNGGELSNIFDDKLENYLKSYYITGGMPEAVETWIKNKDIDKLEEIQQKIIDSYELDFAKHAPSKDFPKLSAIWRSIPEQLAKENSKFIFGQVKKGLRAKDLEDSLEWLISAGLVYKVSKIEKPFMPLSAYADETFFKLYMADIGLMRKMAKLPSSAILEKTPEYKEFKGALTENYVACELVNINNEVPYYWKSENIAEVDFIVQNELEIVPIEVKSERNVRAKSLAEYIKRYKPKTAIITSMKPYALGEIKSIPLYFIWKWNKL
jgi:predicted AAA+ superfamily ATPase